jgi:hypothetical protein
LSSIDGAGLFSIARERRMDEDDRYLRELIPTGSYVWLISYEGLYEEFESLQRQRKYCNYQIKASSLNFIQGDRFRYEVDYNCSWIKN